jgi:hypothetical protein
VKKFVELQFQVSFAQDSREAPGGAASSAAPLMPVFVRAAELSSLLRRNKMESNIESLEELIAYFVREKEWSHMPQENAHAGHYAVDVSEGSIGKGSSADVAELLSDMLKLNGVLVLIDGLDEAAVERGQIESWIDKSMKTHTPLRLMVSTREYAFETSRELGR